MAHDLRTELMRWGALPSQLVSVAHTAEALPWIDLVRTPVDGGTPPIIVTSEGRPRVYVFDDWSRLATDDTVRSWVRRIAFRGDADYVGVLRPGRLDVFLATLPAKAGLPHEVDGLPEGNLRLATLLHAPPAGRTDPVRKQLRNLLLDSLAQVRELGVQDADDALSLVGRALFWRFLIDRRLLDGLEPAATWGVDGSAERSFDTKEGALKVFDWLDRTFNGGLLRFNGRPEKIPADVYTGPLANIAHGATSTGQLRLPTDWNEVDFSHVPVGLLSEIYEAFAHDSDPVKADRESIHYTPRHLAEFVVDEALAALEGVEQPKVLDPAAGAGVFLVATFRALVAREWKRSEKPPTREVVRRILNRQLTGFDINEQALRLAELALYLTAIELDPVAKPRPLSLLRFDPPLRAGTNGKGVLHLREGGLAGGSLGPVREPFKGAFDLVVGNPPWTAGDKKKKGERTAGRNERIAGHEKQWADDTRDLVRTRLGEARARKFAFAQKSPDLPFVFRAMEWAREGGQIALVTHARWLFLRTGTFEQARRDVFGAVRVQAIVNGASLRRPSVWPGIESPFCLFFARNASPQPDEALYFVTPRLIPDAPAGENRLRIDWNDASEVLLRAVGDEPWLLKARFRGTAYDEELLRRLVEAWPSMEAMLKGLEPQGTTLANGYKVGDRSQPAGAVAKLKTLGDDVAFRIDLASLDSRPDAMLEYPRPIKNFRAPLFIVRETPPTEAGEPRSSVAEEDVAFNQSWHGASFAEVSEGLAVARHLQLLVQSKLFLWFQVLTDGRFGVERDRFDLLNLKAFPVAPWGTLPASQRKTSLRLSEKLWANGLTPKLSDQIDEHVFDLYGLDDVDRDVVRDTFATALPWAEQRENAHRPVGSPEVDAFAGCLKESLDDVWLSLGDEAQVRRRPDASTGPWEVLQIDRVRGGKGGKPSRRVPWEKFLTVADESGASLVTVRVDRTTTLVGMLRPFRMWTKTRARLLASSLFSDEEAR